jgi:phage terminase large subunit GpA-like protein
MEIIKHGKKPDYRKKFECPHCGCQFIADILEYRREQSGYNEEALVCICPECKTKCYLYE